MEVFCFQCSYNMLFCVLIALVPLLGSTLCALVSPEDCDELNNQLSLGFPIFGLQDGKYT